MKRKFAMAPLAAAILIAGVLTGCGSSENDKKPSTGASVSSEPTNLKVLLIQPGDPPKLDLNKAKEDIEKRGNVKLELELAIEDVYKDKISLAMANSSTYDLILFDNGKDSVFANYVKQGAFHDLTPYLKDKKNLSLIPEITWTQTKVDNKVYGIPRPRQMYGAQGNIAIRKDWLDKYGLKTPETLSEFNQVMKTFKEKDPAGGGKTVPIVTYPTNSYTVFGWLAPVQFALGMPNGWKIENGAPKYAIQTPEYLTYLDWVKQAWADGLFDKNAPVLKSSQAQAQYLQGIVGSRATNVSELNDSPNGNMAQIRKADPNTNLELIPVLKGPDGKGGIQKSGGYYGLWAIPSTTPKDKVQKIVDYLDFTASEENQAYSQAGIIGMHSTSYKDGKVEQSPEQIKLYKEEQPNLWALENRYDPYLYVKSDASAPVRQIMKNITDSFEKVAVVNPFDGLISETNAKNPDNLKKLSTAALKYVIGEGTLDTVKAEIEGWEKTYGNQIAKEYMEQYNAQKK
ncbi:extracellular solute-binding protein [Paenibacillus sp. LMG 31458]|uniref:Extracellular solute-binding protein n=1 Tax=Paenibacillus phytorum TaxID=2654977 RepID=A0ABX1XTA6_9BACL|nr:extracellular solute-binding protein [Paenibacillus phytorum]NOU71286.1 extracellular solute-binding protein [Paenibacillus phytorum]